MTVTIVSKAGSSNAWATNEKPIDMYPKMMKNYANITPLTAIFTRLREARKAKNVQIDFIEQEMAPDRVQFTGATESSATTPVTIADYAALGLGDMLFNPRTAEYIRVSGAVTDATVDVTRGWGDSDSAVLQTGDWLIVCGNAQEEGISAINTSRIPVNTRQYNYQQIVTNNIDTTWSTDAESPYSGFPKKRAESQAKMNYAFRLQFENALMYGYRASVSGSSLNIRTMGGLMQWLYSGINVLDVPGGIITESMLDNWLTDIHTRRPDIKTLTLFAAPNLINRINQIAKYNGNFAISPNTKLYGLQINRYKGPINIDLVDAPLLAGPYLKGWGWALDLTHIDLNYLRPVMLHKGVNNYNDDDFVRDRIRTEVSLKVAIQERHGMIRNGMA
jgi:hypothetical protein